MTINNLEDSMNIADLSWSPKEKKAARAIFETALKREMTEIEKILKDKIENIEESRNIWEIEQFLTTRRKFIEAKYDFRYSKLIIVFGMLLKEGYLHMDELAELSSDKQGMIKAFTE